MQNIKQQMVVVRWYQHNGNWVSRIVLAVAIALLSHGLLGLWPVYNPGLIILLAALIGLVGAERPMWGLCGFALAFAPSLLYGSGSLTIVFVALCLVILVFIPKAADTPLKLALILASPVALQHGWFFFAAILGGLVYANAAVITSAVGAVFGLLVAWLDGWQVAGVFPLRASWLMIPSQPVTFSNWISQNLTKPNWIYLSYLGHGIAQYVVSVIAGIVIISLTTRLVAALRKKRGLREYATSVFLPTIAASTAWILMSNEMHPSLSAALIVIPTSLLAAVAALLVGRTLLSPLPSPQPLPLNTATATETQPATNTGSTTALSRLRKASWDDISGYADVKEELREAVQPYINSKVRRELEKQGYMEHQVLVRLYLHVSWHLRQI